MEISEIRNKLKETENRIREILTDFMEECDVDITYISLDWNDEETIIEKVDITVIVKRGEDRR